MSVYRPHLGPPRVDQHARTCGFSFDLNSPKCGAPATVHIAASVRDDGVLAALSACDAHATVARLAGNHVMEHPYAGNCSMPGTVWNFRENRCTVSELDRARVIDAHAAVSA